MTILSPTRSEKLTVQEYTKIMSDKVINNNIISTRYEINHDWSSPETGRFLVEYDKMILREKTI